MNVNGSNIQQEPSDIARTDITDGREDDRGGEESWSDEEGEDPSYTYNYLRRRRYI